MEFEKLIRERSSTRKFSNQKVELPNDIFIENGVMYHIMVPLRAICEALGYNVGWDNNLRTVSIKKTDEQTEIVFTIGSFNVNTPYGQKTIGRAPKIIEGHTYIKLSALMEVFNETISWDDESNSLYIWKEPKNNDIFIEKDKVMAPVSEIDKVLEYWYGNLNTSYILKAPKYDDVEFCDIKSSYESTDGSIYSGYLPQIKNPSNAENKINERILSILQYKVDKEFISINDEKIGVDPSTKVYYGIVRNNKNNIFSISCDRISRFNFGMPHDIYSCSNFNFTYYKDTGRELQIEDILKGTKENIEQTIIAAYGKEVFFTGVYQAYANRSRTVGKRVVPFENIKNILLDNYDFYIENDNLVFTILYENSIGEFGLNITDNASLFQEDFLKNFNDKNSAS